MTTRRSTPDTSSLQRARPLAYSRRQKTGGDETEATSAGEEMVDAESALAAFAQAFAAKRTVDPDEVARPRAETMSMPFKTPVGEPPAIPEVAASPCVDLGTVGPVENPTLLPGPRDIPGGDPNARAPAPGMVPAGDSRSLRRGGEFALIYRLQTFVISRFGAVGTRGQWRVVEYPTSASAAHAYAQETSRFVGDGFSDYRE